MQQPSCLAGGGDAGARLRAIDWSRNPLGPVASWPMSLQAAVRIVLSSEFPMMLHWGPELITIYNDAYAPSLGKKHPGNLGQPAKEWWSEMWDQLAPIFDQVLAGKPFFVEDARYTPDRDGTPQEAFFTHCHSPLWDDDGQIAGIFLVVTETTRSIVAERKLAEVNANLARQVEERTAERDHIWQHSLDMLGVADHQGVWLAINPAWNRLLGWEPDEVVGRTSEWIEHPDDQARTRAEISQLALGQTTFEFGNRFRARNGDYRTLSWTATFSGAKIYAIGRDVTQEWNRAQALHDAEDFARLALRSVGGVGVWTFDASTDRFTCDAAIADLYGIDPERGAVGVPAAEFVSNVHPDDRARLRETMANGLQKSGELELEYRIVHADGAVRWVLSRGITYFDEAGRPVRRTGVGIETTKQREIEEALRQSQKMEAVGQLTGGLAHDFNNLLAVITGSLDLMGRRLAQNRVDQLDKFMDAAQSAARRAASLTHRLLAFSRRQTLDPKPTNVSSMVEDMQDMINRTVGPEISVAIVPADDIWTSLVDPSQLENALLNLCINARDAMPDGGRMTIETANTHIAPGRAAVRDMPPGQYVALSVSDTGIGMPPEVIARVFEPFYTTKPIGQGTGLGLSMVYGFAKQSEGQVRIHSEVGRGTTVTIYLPRSLTEVVADQNNGSSMPDRVERGRTVLVVDDEEHIRMLIADVLQDLGCDVLEAETGQAGLTILQATPWIDLLITDVGMPGGMNGRQLADAARQHHPNLKTLFITGYAETAVVSHGHLEQGMAILTKPFAIEVLANRVKEMIESDRTLRQT